MSIDSPSSPAGAGVTEEPAKPDLDSIKGWFYASDRRMFAWLLQHQADTGQRGHLVELGCYLGKSAVLIGSHVRADETFTVLDLFESDAPDEQNITEMGASYSTLTQAAFEANYLRFHDVLPKVVKAPSSTIVDVVPAGSCRFIHVDASHLYEHVAGDVDSARSLLRPEGVVVFDDFRSVHTPGVAAAVWEAVLTKGLRPVLVTESKLYGTWGDPTALRADLMAWLKGEKGAFMETQRIAGHDVLRVAIPLEAPVPVPAPPPVVVEKVPEVVPAKPARSGLRLLAKQWLPPVVHARLAARRSQRS